MDAEEVAFQARASFQAKKIHSAERVFCEN